MELMGSFNVSFSWRPREEEVVDVSGVPKIGGFFSPQIIHF